MCGVRAWAHMYGMARMYGCMCGCKCDVVTTLTFLSVSVLFTINYTVIITCIGIIIVASCVYVKPLLFVCAHTRARALSTLVKYHPSQAAFDNH